MNWITSPPAMTGKTLEEMERLVCGTIDKLPGVTSCSCNIIFSRIKDIKGLRL